jgi:hypothetical protein
METIEIVLIYMSLLVVGMGACLVGAIREICENKTVIRFYADLVKIGTEQTLKFAEELRRVRENERELQDLIPWYIAQGFEQGQKTTTPYQNPTVQIVQDARDDGHIGDGFEDHDMGDVEIVPEGLID